MNKLERPISSLEIAGIPRNRATWKLLIAMWRVTTRLSVIASLLRHAYRVTGWVVVDPTDQQLPKWILYIKYNLILRVVECYKS